MTDLDTLVKHIGEDMSSPMCIKRGNTKIRLSKVSNLLLIILTSQTPVSKKVLHNTYLGIKEEYSYILDAMTGKEIRWFYKIDQGKSKGLGVK